MLFPGDVSPQGRHAGAYDPSTNRKRKLPRILLILLILALLIWPFAEPFMLETQEITLTGVDLPEEIRSLRVVYLTDVHMGGLFGDGRLRDLISEVNRCKPDLVLMGGDYAQDSASAVTFFEQLPSINARYGVYAVVGNNDRPTPQSNLTQLRAAMLGAGVTPLVNEVAHVRIGNSTIHIAGVDDFTCGFPDYRAVARQVKEDDYTIFLCHNPAAIPEAMKAVDQNGYTGWFDLGLFGHTHGGQVALFGSLKDTGVPERYASGLLRENRADLLISNGVGTSGLPVRWLCRPQIHCITIQH